MLRKALQILIQNRRAYLAINLGYYGLVIAAMLFASFNRQIQQTLLEAIGEGFSQGMLADVVEAYTEGRLLQAIGLTFTVNLFLGSLAVITLPSLILPFSGMLVGAYRAILWGLLFSPGAAGFSDVGILPALFIAGLLFLEGQGYVLALLAAYVQGRSFLQPRSVGVERHTQGYWEGVKRALLLYLLVVIVLGIAAIYEAAGVIFGVGT
jgi:hypothetical protein